MRNAFSDQLYEIIKQNPDAYLLTADIGFRVFDKILDEFPDRFINMGVAEANMISVASGMSMEGKKVFVYTIIPFLTMRAYEQIRVDVCIQNQPVKIVGVGGGLAYGNLGPTHHSIEDIAILRALPNMTVISPCDPMESRKATLAAFKHKGPVYIRLGKNGEPTIYKQDYEFRIGKAVTLRQGSDATIISTGFVNNYALESAEQLSQQGIEVRVLNMHTIKPIDREAVLDAAQNTRAMITLEEHNIIGGLGSAVAEILAESHFKIPFKRIGIPDVISYEVGEQESLIKKYDISSENIASVVKDLLDN